MDIIAEVNYLQIPKKGIILVTYKKQESLKPGEESAYEAMFFETVTAAFQELVKSGVFNDDAGEITYFITMSDDDRAPEIEKYSAKLLNSEKNYRDFVKKTE